MDIVNSKKIMSELIKNFYAKNKFQPWNVCDYDNISKLVIFNGHSIFRVFKENFLPIAENETGFKKDTLIKVFNTDLTDYKKSEKIEINAKYDDVNKNFFNCLDDKIYFDNDLLKYLDKKQKYDFYYKAEKQPIFVKCNDYIVAMILPVNIKN